MRQKPLKIEQCSSALRENPQAMESEPALPETREVATPRRNAARHKKAAHHKNVARSKAEPADTVNQ